MKNFFFPWRRIAELQHTVEAATAKIAELERELGINKLHRSNAKSMIASLRAAIAEGHFRNPATGRLGRKGETFDKGTKP